MEVFGYKAEIFHNQTTFLWVSDVASGIIYRTRVLIWARVYNLRNKIITTFVYTLLILRVL